MTEYLTLDEGIPTKYPDLIMRNWVLVVVFMAFLMTPVVLVLMTVNSATDCPVNICNPWLYVSEFQITAGLTIVTLFLLVLGILKQTDSRLLKFKIPLVLRRHLAFPFSFIFMALAFAGAFLFILFAMCDIYPLVLSVPAPLRKMVAVTWTNLRFLPGMNYGSGGFVVWVFAVLCLIPARGVMTALKFGVFLVLALTVIVLLFQPREMTDHVAVFAKGLVWNTQMVPGPNRGGGPIYLASNWIALVFSGFITIFNSVKSILKRFHGDE